MKNFARFVFIVLIVSSVFAVGGCKHSVEELSYEKMIAEYNEKYFTKGYLPPQPYTTSSKNFNENEILDDIISMEEDTLTILTAPDGGDGCTYKWLAHVPAKDSNGKDYIKETVIGNERTLSYKAPGVFNSDKENKLVVTVTEKSGRQYTDTAKVFIDIE